MIRFREAFREAWRNVWSGTTHMVRWCLLLLAVVAAGAWLDTTWVTSLTNDAADYLQHNGSTWVLEAPGQISGEACDALGSADSVLAAGAARAERDGLRTLALPRAPIPLYSVTPGFLGVASATGSGGLVVSDNVAARYGLTAPDTLGLANGTVLVGGTYPYPDDGRRSGLGFAALSVTPSQAPFDECWIRIWPPSQNTAMLTYTAVLPAMGDPMMTAQNVKLSQANPTFASSFDGYTGFATRLTRWIPLATAAAGFLIGIAATATRRLEYASDLHAGIPKSFLGVQCLVEALSWIIPACILALVGVVVGAYPAQAETRHIALLGMRPIVTGGAASLIGAVLAVWTVRESRLFTLFKNR
ncbi:MAG: hypothetical protein LBN10_11100 [Propionibacteriaceae bacterium]|jgi:hypothetical protein|nr:hypothetical protein [Propionibacteriaceae bacterium]